MGFRVREDFGAGTLSRKIREAQLAKVPYLVIIGDKEVLTQTLSVRTWNGTVYSQVSVKGFMYECERLIREKSMDISLKDL